MGKVCVKAEPSLDYMCVSGTQNSWKVCVKAEPSLVTTCMSVALKTADFSHLD